MFSEKANAPKGGFFKEFFRLNRIKLSESKINVLTTLESDEDKFRYVFSLPSTHDVRVKECYKKKDEDEAKKKKEEGNGEFGKGNYKNALELYNMSVLLQPVETADQQSEFAIIVGNRSAALYHLNELQLTLADIQLAMENNYPQRLWYKVYEREARCYARMRRNNLAAKSCKAALKSLEFSQLDRNKKLKLEDTLKKLLKISETIKPTLGPEPLTISPPQPDVELTGGPHKSLPGASAKLELRSSPELGRYIVAAEDIFAGDVLIIEKAANSVLQVNKISTYCPACYRCFIAPVPCPKCAGIAFCSSKCCKDSEHWHRFECLFGDLLIQSGMSFTCYMALRFVTKTSLDNLKSSTENEYSAVQQLVTHRDKRTAEGFYERALMATFLVRCLMIGKFFPDDIAEKWIASDEYPKNVPSIISYVGGLILTYLQLLQFNAHEVSEFQLVKEDNTDGAKSELIGAGVFTTLAMMNHGCDPSILRYFCGDTVVVMAIKSHKKGETVFENYGPIFTHEPRAVRQKKLKDYYWFDCTCTPCTEDWPVFDKMEDTLRFKCSNTKCGVHLPPLPQDSLEVLIKCPSCYRETSIIQSLKQIQKSEEIFNEGCEYLKNGKNSEALAKFCEKLNLVDEVLQAPYKDYHYSQEAVRKCALFKGNKRVVSEPKTYDEKENGEKKEL